MFWLIRKASALALGGYIVLESQQYGLHKNYRRLGRFFSLSEAKAFAKENSSRLQSRVVVMAADKMAKVCVYQPRRHQMA